jgi:citrate lyase subunit beta/citryl-CoA lyase
MSMVVALFVPGDRPERFAKASASGADTAILDLEDAVAPDRKAVARDAVRDALRAGTIAYVRINTPASDDGAADLAMLAELADTGTLPPPILVPKVSGIEDIDLVRDVLPDAALVVLIESVDGLREAVNIARAPGVRALAFGAFDMCAELGARPTPEVLGPLRSQIILAARAGGVTAIDAPFLGLDDEAGLLADARRALDFGFDAKLAVHPSQVAPIKSVFAPTPDELARAHRIVAAAQIGGVSVVDGKMVDGPVFAAARRVLARAGEPV